MAYANGLFYIDPENGSDTARTALTSCTASNPSGTITRINKTAHGLITGAVVGLTSFTSWLNSSWKITVVDADNFDLDSAVWQTTADASGTVTPRGGSSKADAWKTGSSGATATRIQPGDTIRVMASPEPTLVGNATWTQYSKTVTLPGAVTANISDCETAWTGSANVTQTADTVDFKAGTKSAKSVFAAGFTTGLAAYFATGTLNLSAYQQVSFWYKSSGTLASGVLTLRLCSDAAGVTAVHTITIPANGAGGQWLPVTVDLGTNLNSAIQSVALYAESDPGTATVYLDNIIACKASSSADAITLHSLLGKVWNRVWEASTTYAVDDIRKPTQPNRNGFRYKVTAQTAASGSSEPTWPEEYGATVTDGGVTWVCEGLEDTWYPIQSISGTTVLLDCDTNTKGSEGRGYSGATETVATYRREAVKLAPQSSPLTSIFEAKESGTSSTQITYTGGWDRTSMAAQTGETWMDAQNGLASCVGTYNGGASYVTFANLSGTRFSYGLVTHNCLGIQAYNCQFTGCGRGFHTSNVLRALVVRGMAIANSSSDGWLNNYDAEGEVSQVSSCGASALNGFSSTTLSYTIKIRYRNLVALNNAVYGFDSPGATDMYVRNLRTANNGSGGVHTAYADLTLRNSTIADGVVAPSAGADSYIRSEKDGGVADSHVLTTDGGTIVSATDQRYDASGISWKFRPTVTTRGAARPLRLSVAKLACAANQAVNLTIYTRRDSTNIQGQLKVRGGQISGVGKDVVVSCAPAINTWEQSGTLTFTPTEAGVVEIIFECWDGVGTTNSFWIDRLTAS